MWTEFEWTLPVALVLLGHPLGPVLQNLITSRPILGEKRQRKKNKLRNHPPHFEDDLISNRSCHTGCHIKGRKGMFMYFLITLHTFFLPYSFI